MATNQRTPLLVGVVVVLLGTSGYVLFSGGGDTGEIGKRVSSYGICLACQHEGPDEYAWGEQAPHECTECGAPAVYPLYQCYNCKQRFVPQLDRSTDPPRVPSNIVCTGCGSSSVVPFIPEAMTEEPVGDVLPAWP